MLARERCAPSSARHNADPIHPPMNLEALAVIGTLAVVAGVILYLPFFLWKKWRGEKALPQTGPLADRITATGITFYGAMVVVLFAGFAQEHLAPQTAFGSFMSDWYGRLVYGGCVLLVFIVLEIGFRLAGVKFSTRKGEDV